jgi:hypothetical protein
MAEGDRMSEAYAAVPAMLTSPWAKGSGVYRFDQPLLERLLTVQLRSASHSKANLGALAIAVDIWIATELRRAGIEVDAVWPRPTQPRVLAQAMAKASARFKFARDAATRAVQEATVAELERLAGQSSTSILGGFFAKEIDVVVAEYDRGLELAVSTKTMTGSFGKNITNRFEEASGDLLNIRRRYPLATFGYVFLVTENVLEEPHGWERIKDMCRKLTSLAPGDDRGNYDSSCLIVIDTSGASPTVIAQEIPEDLHPDRFFETMLHGLFSRSPVSEHTRARQLWEDSRFVF